MVSRGKNALSLVQGSSTGKFLQGRLPTSLDGIERYLGSGLIRGIGPVFARKLVGTFGNAATFSFYPGKNLGAYGDAGCIVTNDDRLADWTATFARHGGKVRGRDGEAHGEPLALVVPGAAAATVAKGARSIARKSSIVFRMVATSSSGLRSDAPIPGKCVAITATRLPLP